MLNVTLAAPQRHDRLTVFPLVAQDAPELPFLLMADALMLGTLRISEVGSGVVGELAAANSAEQPVLVLDGEQLVGAKQNRTTNRSLLVPARSELRIPVSCMEQGRWHDQSRPLTTSKDCSPTNVRRRAREVEAHSASAGEEMAPAMLSMAQGSVWRQIRLNFDSMQEHSATGALDELYAKRESDLDAALKHFTVVEEQVGLLAFVGSQSLGLDVIGSQPLYAKLHARLLSGYVMDGLASREGPQEVGSDAAQVYLDTVREAARASTRTVGAGNYEVLTGSVIGGELTHESAMVHLSAFPAVEHDRSATADPHPISPPSRRRR